MIIMYDKMIEHIKRKLYDKDEGYKWINVSDHLPLVFRI